MPVLIMQPISPPGSTRLSAVIVAEVRVIGAGVTSEGGLERVEDLLRSDQRVALLVNNAGNGKFSSTIAMANEDTASTLALNVVTPSRLARAVLPALLRSDASAIINISSVMAFHSLPITTLYSATKTYVLTLSLGLVGEVVGTGVCV